MMNHYINMPQSSIKVEGDPSECWLFRCLYTRVIIAIVLCVCVGLLCRFRPFNLY